MDNLPQKSIMEFCRVNQEKCETTEGFDVQAGLTWIYPTNYPLRDYQYNIIEQALYKNTLVNLPTGLGKTFIAAVVMYNYYRWYPTGKIVFMAPTRPLVKQQVDACYDIMAIPKDVTVELTGTNKNSLRNEIWMDKRVFFITPQILQNDLDKCPELALLIKCIVFDEAHRARGNYAYCEVMKKMKAQAKYFRVLALSATPGNSINDVGEVINTLMISHLEYRTEESVDVKPYVFHRKLDTLVVPLGQKLEQVRNDYLEILEKYSRTLLKYKVVQGNCSTLTKGAIFRIKKEYQEKSSRDPHYREVMLTLNICMSLFHASELLIRHGLRGFLSYFEEHINDPLLRNNIGLIRLMEDVRSYLGPMPVVEKLPDGTYPEVPSNTIFGHPKFYKLRDVLISHFNNSDDNSKVIVFFEYRDSVKEAFLILLQARPIIRPEMFVGQRSGVVTQKMQLRVIKTFRDGDCNTLLSTSIGEEGLDVGEVDLIICFDISNKSPIRMVQRMGRTGRKREGQVVILVTEGREQQTLNDCLFHKNNMKSWAGSMEIMRRFFVESPRMVPKEIMPQCMKMQITVTKPTVMKNGTLKNFVRKMSCGSTSAVLDDVEIIEIEERIPKQIALFNKSLPHIVEFDFQAFYSDKIEHQRSLQHGSKIGASDASKLFINLMKFADSKRFNIPLTQGSVVPAKNLRQGDIRNMFNIGAKNSNTPSQGDSISQAFSLPTQKELSSQEIEEKKFRDKLHGEISIYLSIAENTPKTCKFCERGFKCTKYSGKKESSVLEDINSWIPPSDMNVLKKITPEHVEAYKKWKLEAERKDELTNKDKVSNKDEVTKKHEVTNENEGAVIPKSDDVEDSILELLDSDLSDLFPDEKIDEKVVKDKSFSFNAPKSFGNLVDKYNITATIPSQIEAKPVEDCNLERTKILSNVNISNSNTNKDVEKNTSALHQANIVDQPRKDENLDPVLSFFKLDKIEDIFDIDIVVPESDDSQKTIIDEDVAQILEFERESSPVLSTQVSRNKKIHTKQKKIIVEEPGSPVLDTSSIWRSQKDISFKRRPSLDIINTSIEETLPKKFTQKKKVKITEKNNMQRNTNKRDTIQEKSMTSDEENLLGLFSSKKKNTTSEVSKPLSIEHIFDLWSFGLTIDDLRKRESSIFPIDSEEKENIGHSSNYQKKDESHDFSMLVNAESTRIEREDTKKYSENKLTINHGNLDCEEKQLSKNLEKEPSVLEIDDFCDLSIFGLTQHEEEMRVEQQKMNQRNNNSKSEVSEVDKTIKFDDFAEHMSTEYMSTQNKYSNLNTNLRSVEHSCHKQIPEQKETKEISHEEKIENQDSHVETNANNDESVIIIEESPTKDSFIDLTQSPKGKNKLPPKRKILSQMSITQILSLAEKSTQSILSPSNSVSSSANKTKQCKSPIISKSQQINKHTNIRADLADDLDDFEDLNNEKTSPRPSEKICNSNLLDDLRNFDEFNDSGLFKSPSPVFKKPSTSKVNLSKFRKETKNLNPPSQPGTSKFDLNSTMDSEKDLHNHSACSKLNNSSLLNSNSDDEFESTIYPSPTRRKKQTLQKKTNDSSPPIPRKKVRKKTRTFDFIEHEAEVSIDQGSLSEDESDEDGSFDESFVDDDTQNLANNTQMHVNYLRSVRSPKKGLFKFPRTLRPITDDIFSQPAVRDELNSYEVDSFCINNEEVIEESNEMTELEILEKKLKEKRRKRKQSDDENKRIKRRRIRMMDSDSD